MNAVIEKDYHLYRTTLEGGDIGTFRSEREARQAILREMRDRYGLVPESEAAQFLAETPSSSMGEPCPWNLA